MRNLLMFLTLFLFTSITSVSETETADKLTESYNKIDSLQAEIQRLKSHSRSLTYQLDWASSTIDSLSSSQRVVAEMFKRKSRLFKDIVVNGHIPGTSFFLDPHKFYDTRIEGGLYRALLEAECPPVTVTSLTRKSRRGSNHFYGKAVDIRLDEQGKRFAKWLVSPSGTKWREEHRVKFYVEDKYNSESVRETVKRDSSLQQHILLNPHCTGPHIHLEL